MIRSFEETKQVIVHAITLPLVQAGLKLQVNPKFETISSLVDKSSYRFYLYTVLYIFPRKAVKKTRKYYEETFIPKSVGIKPILMRVFGDVFFTSLIYPLSNIQSRLLSQARYKSSMDCLVQTYQKDGLTGFYSGWIYSAIGHTVYGLLSEALNHLIRDEEGVSWKVSVSTAAYVISYPLKTMKERSILDGTMIDGVVYHSKLNGMSFMDYFAGLPLNLFSILAYEYLPLLKWKK